jgi:hypothetical protein
LKAHDFVFFLSGELVENDDGLLELIVRRSSASKITSIAARGLEAQLQAGKPGVAAFSTRRDQTPTHGGSCR